MTALSRVRVAWTGFNGAPGVSTFYFLDTDTALDSLQGMFSGAIDMFPTDVHFQVENTGDVIEDTTGVITGSWVSDAQPPLVGTTPGPYAAPSGAMIGWETGAVVDGRRLRGKTFLVPITGAAYDPDGTLTATCLARFTAVSIGFVAAQSTSFVIWHRPEFGPRPAGGGPRPMLRPGGHSVVTGSRVPDKVVVLRSRRD